jgi:hypothetical protein
VAISRASNSSIQGGLPKFNDIWDGTTATSAYDSLGAVVLSATTGSVTFSSIPSTYTHLQIRITCQASATNGGTVGLSTNGDTTNNYTYHLVGGNGSSVFAAGYTLNTSMPVGNGIQQSGVNGVSIVDILDYTSTNKYKTVRSLSGVDNNSTGGVVSLQSGALFTANGLSAVSSITLSPQSASFIANSSFALYGIK